MKALLFILCILFASTLSMPNFTLARQLAEKEVTPVVLTPGTVPCGRGTYTKCIPKQPTPRTPPKCTRYSKCLPEKTKPPPPPKCNPHYKRGCN
ncbi:hypothetical protein PTKIN_Ptkin11bG0157700 [Pterospermum kingtungense]